MRNFKMIDKSFGHSIKGNKPYGRAAAIVKRRKEREEWDKHEKRIKFRAKALSFLEYREAMKQHEGGV